MRKLWMRLGDNCLIILIRPERPRRDRRVTIVRPRRLLKRLIVLFAHCVISEHRKPTTKPGQPLISGDPHVVDVRVATDIEDVLHRNSRANMLLDLQMLESVVQTY